MTIENTTITTPTNDAPIAPTPEATVVAPVAQEAAPITITAEPTAPAAQEAPIVEPAPEAPKAKEPSLLDAPVEPEVKKDEAQEPAKENEVAQSDEPAPLPSYEPFNLPEGIALEQEKLTEFTNKLAEFETTTKADHAEVQKLGQGLVDLYLSEVTQTTERINKYYADAWEKQTNDWKESFFADPEIGGARQQTTLNAANTFIKTHGGTPEQQAEFRKVMTETGVGNHPAVIRFLANAAGAFSEAKPLSATTPAFQPQSKVERRYGKNN